MSEDAEKPALRVLAGTLALTVAVAAISFYVGLKDLARYQLVWAFPPLAALIPMSLGVAAIKRAISGQTTSGIGLSIVMIVMALICCGLGLFAILAGEMVSKGPIVS